jgi:excisionase family DNA binding protein
MVLINNRIHLSVEECAARVGVAGSTVYSWLNRYQLPRLRIAHTILIAEEDLTDFLAKKTDRRKRPVRKNPEKPEKAAKQ